MIPVVADRDDGSLLPVRAKPGARQSRVLGERAGRLLVEVNQPADRGKANEAIRRVLAEALDLPRGDIEIRAGHTSRDKLVLVRGISPADLSERVHDLWEAAGDGG